MINEQENVQAVQQLFVAFGQGNFGAVLQMLAEDVDYQSPVTRTETAEISWAKPCHSREEVSLHFIELLEYYLHIFKVIVNNAGLLFVYLPNSG